LQNGSFEGLELSASPDPILRLNCGTEVKINLVESSSEVTDVIMSESIKEKSILTPPSSKEKDGDANKFKLQTAVNYKLTGLPVVYQVDQLAKQDLFHTNKQEVAMLKTKKEDSYGSK
jgi:hypothetical protein